PVLPTSRAEVTQLASNDNPNVVAAQYTEASARDAVGVIRGQLLPQISIVGDANRSEESEFSRRVDNTFSVIARMTVPLYEGGAVYSQTRQAIETVGERRSEIDDARRTAVQTAQADWETLVATRARIESLQSTIRAAQIALEG